MDPEPHRRPVLVADLFLVQQGRVAVDDEIAGVVRVGEHHHALGKVVGPVEIIVIAPKEVRAVFVEEGP